MSCCVFACVHRFHSKHFDTPEQRAQKQTATAAMLRAGFDLMVSDEYNHVIRVVAPGGMSGNTPLLLSVK
jgi:hypothetical protein